MIKSGTANDLCFHFAVHRDKVSWRNGIIPNAFQLLYLLVVGGHPATWRQILSAYLTYSVVGFFHCLLWTSQKEKKRKIEIRNLPAPLGRCIQTRDILSFVGGERKKKRTRSIDNTKLRRAAGRYMKKKIQSIVQHICIDGRVLSWLAIKVNQSGGSLLFNSRYESKKKKIHKKKRHANRECIG